MTTQTGPAKPAPAKRGLFNRPKWAATSVKAEATTAALSEKDDFFSRSNETFASFAAQEEEREKRRHARRTAAEARHLTPTRDTKPSQKRRRISAEHDETDDDDEHLSDIEAERAEELAAAAKAKADAQNGELSGLLDKGKALVREGRAQLGFNEDARSPSPSELPANVQIVPTDEQCDQIRARVPQLAVCEDETIRRLARIRRERNEQEQMQAQSMVPLSSPSRQLHSSGKTRSKLILQSASPRGSPSTGPAVGANKAATVALDNEDETPALSPTSTKSLLNPVPLAIPPAPIPIEDNPEDEFAEIERRAREKARQKRLMEGKALSTSPGLGGNSPTPNAPSTTLPIQATSHAQELEATVKLLITSDIAGLKSLVVSRKISQRFKEVREYWCHFNELSEAMRPKITLTWKGRRLYDSQSCASLGFATGSDGNAVYKSADHDMFDDYEGKLHFIAVGEGIPGAPAPTGANGTASQASEPEAVPAPVPEDEIRVIIRGKGFPECKIIVRPSTVISRMIDAFKKNGRVPEEKTVALMFDGELLQPNSTIGQTDISDLEHIDAYVR